MLLPFFFTLQLLQFHATLSDHFVLQTFLERITLQLLDSLRQQSIDYRSNLTWLPTTCDRFDMFFVDDTNGVYPKFISPSHATHTTQQRDPHTTDSFFVYFYLVFVQLSRICAHKTCKGNLIRGGKRVNKRMGRWKNIWNPRKYPPIHRHVV